MVSRGLFTLAVALTLSSAVFAGDQIRVFFGPKAADDPNGIYANLLTFIDSAQIKLHAAIHEIDMISIAERIASRAKAGVEVEIVVEGEWWTNPKNKAARQVLEKAKVHVIPDTKKSGLMHNKFFIADGKRVWTGSTNITETCLLFNPNNSLWIESVELAQNYEAMFGLYQQGKFGKKPTTGYLTPHPTIRLDQAIIQTYFSPKDDPIPDMVSHIEQAKVSIDVMCFVFSSQPLGEALIAAHRRGVKVRILLDNQYSHPGLTKRWSYVPFKELHSAQIACKYDDEDSKLHHKVMIIDNRTVITGSFNFSVSAIKDNDENLLIIQSPDIAKRYRGEFDRLWQYYRGDPGVAPLPELGDDR